MAPILVKCPFMYHSTQDHSTGTDCLHLSRDSQDQTHDSWHLLTPAKFTGHPLPRTLVSVLICISLNRILFPPSTLPRSPRAPPTAITTVSDGLTVWFDFLPLGFSADAWGSLLCHILPPLSTTWWPYCLPLSSLSTVSPSLFKFLLMLLLHTQQFFQSLLGWLYTFWSGFCSANLCQCLFVSSWHLLKFALVYSFTKPFSLILSMHSPPNSEIRAHLTLDALIASWMVNKIMIYLTVN